ncbi:MAG: DUF3244 domain-containing protein [Bacteroidales bacterium]|nr:DUF3244 domain-containing protein [Bacteroidales bacterium]
MKKGLMIISLLLSIFATVYGAPNGSFKISLERANKEVTSSRPRNVIRIPIYAIWNGLDNGIYLNFMDNIGNVSISVWNMSTGEIYNDFINSNVGQAILYTSGTSGEYFVQIETEYGEVYEGKFNI